ncbi:hypothetical protein ABZ313_29770 [Streptomyces sp. NPDC006251]|uniref:hypothetical protein n=1 Tax=Streptomyces sp. NPDC006251 TaxID=3155718 RepID=UPI0033B8C4C8
MSDGEQDYGAWRTEQHRRAQAHAFGWAQRATTEYGQAVRHEDDARERQQYDSGWQRDRAAESRTLAQFHGVRSTEALKLAEMWAAVARALADGELPMATVIEARGPHHEQDSPSDTLADPNAVGRLRAG